MGGEKNEKRKQKKKKDKGKAVTPLTRWQETDSLWEEVKWTEVRLMKGDARETNQLTDTSPQNLATS